MSVRSRQLVNVKYNSTQSWHRLCYWLDGAIEKSERHTHTHTARSSPIHAQLNSAAAKIRRQRVQARKYLPPTHRLSDWLAGSSKQTMRALIFNWAPTKSRSLCSARQTTNSVRGVVVGHKLDVQATVCLLYSSSCLAMILRRTNCSWNILPHKHTHTIQMQPQL